MVVVRQPGVIQELQKLAHGMIDVADVAQVAVQLAPAAGGEGPGLEQLPVAGAPALHRGLEVRSLAVQVVVGVGRQGKGILVVQIPEPLRRRVALVRLGEVGLQEERAALVRAAAHEVDAGAGQVALLPILVAHLAGTSVAGLSAGGAELLHRAVILQLGEAALGQVVGVLRRAAANAAAAGFQEVVHVILHPVLRAVDLADGAGTVAVAAQMSEQGGQTAGVGTAQAVVAVVVAVLTRQPAGPARCADRVLGDSVVEAHPLGGEAVQMRRARVGVALVPQHLGVMLVGEQQQNVRPATHASTVGLICTLIECEDLSRAAPNASCTAASGKRCVISERAPAA